MLFHHIYYLTLKYYILTFLCTLFCSMSINIVSQHVINIAGCIFSNFKSPKSTHIYYTFIPLTLSHRLHNFTLSKNSTTHFIAADPLVSRDVMLNFSKSVLMKKQTHLLLGWAEGEQIYFSNFFIFG